MRHGPANASIVLMPCSSVNVLDRVLEIARTTLDSQPHMHAGAIEEAEGQQRAGRLPRLPSVATLRKTYDGVQQLMDGQSGRHKQTRGMDSTQIACHAYSDRSAAYAPALLGQLMVVITHRSAVPNCAGSGGAQLSKIASALAESPRFLILDFRQALGCTLFAA